jgi:hemolysin III
MISLFSLDSNKYFANLWYSSNKFKNLGLFNKNGASSSSSTTSAAVEANQEKWFHSEFLPDIEKQQNSKQSVDNDAFMQLADDQEEQNRKFHDDRLFPDHPLYCEGMPKPAFRGLLHLLCSLLLPFGFYHLFFLESNSNIIGQLAVAIYLFGQFFCCFISAIYHIGKYSPSTEIILQKLDHCGIAVCTTAINYPVCLLLLPFPYGSYFLLLSTLTCGWTCWNILNRRPGVWRLVVTASTVVFFLPLLAYHMTIYEFLCVLANIVFMCCGVYIFSSKYPDPFPTKFGYHELFHVFTVLGFLSIYFCNWSVIRRTCQPYHLNRDIFEDILFKMIF